MNKGYYLGQMRYYSGLIRLSNTKKSDYESLSSQLSSYANSLDAMKNNLNNGKELLLNGGFSIEGVSFSGEKCTKLILLRLGVNKCFLLMKNNF